jgi:hypothetical protein
MRLSTAPVGLMRRAVTRQPVIGDQRAIAVRAPPGPPAWAVPMTGVPGTVTVVDGCELGLVPAAVTARTRKR